MSFYKWVAVNMAIGLVIGFATGIGVLGGAYTLASNLYILGRGTK